MRVNMINGKSLTPQQANFTADLFSTPDEKCKFLAKALLISRVAGTALDEICDTPLRDLQVFDPKVYGDLAGIGLHSILTPITIAFTLVGALPFITKVFNKNTVNNLSDLIDNITDFDPGFDLSDKSLKKKFDAFLQKKGFGHLEIEIITKQKRSALLSSFLGKLEKKSVQFKYREGDGLQQILFSEWSDNKNKPIISIIDDLIVKIAPKGELGKLDLNQQEFLARLIDRAKDSTDPNILDILALIKLLPLIINKDNTLNKEITLEQLRDTYLHQINSWSFSSIMGGAYDLTMDYSFNFWLTFFVADLLECNADTSKWKYLTQTIVLVSAAVISGIQLSWQALHAWYTGEQQKEATYITSDQKIHSAITRPSYKNKDLKHQLLEEFFIEQLIEKRKKEVLVDKNRLPKIPERENLKSFSNLDPPTQLAKLRLGIQHEIQHDNAYKRKRQIEAILHEEENYTEVVNKYNKERKIPVNNYQSNKPLLPPRKMGMQVYRPVKTKISEQFDLLRDEVAFAKEYNDPSRTTWQTVQLFGKRYFSISQSVFKYCIGIGFIGWVVGAAMVAAGSTVGPIILGNPVSVACAVGGALVGLVTSYAKVGQDEKAEIELQQKFEKSEKKVEKLEKLESKNYQLKQLLKENQIKPLTTLKAHDDRVFRRLTAEKPGLFTKFKQGVNRFAVAVGRGGSGILIIRLAVLPALAMGAIFGGPVGLGLAVTLGLIWGAANIYHFHQASKIEAAKRTLDDIDNRIEIATANQEIYLNQLGYSNSLTNEEDDDDIIIDVAQPQGLINPIRDIDARNASEPVHQSILLDISTGEIQMNETAAQIIRRIKDQHHAMNRNRNELFSRVSLITVFKKNENEIDEDHLRRIIAEARKPGIFSLFADSSLFEAMNECGYFYEDGELSELSPCFNFYWNEVQGTQVDNAGLQIIRTL